MIGQQEVQEATMQHNDGVSGGKTGLILMVLCCVVMLGVLALVGLGVWSFR